MLYYKQKILLAALEAFGGSLNNLKFQKYLFLIMKRLDKKYYHFIPYKYGCFSFESYSDKRRLLSYLKDDESKWVLNDSNATSSSQMSFDKILKNTISENSNQKNINKNHRFLFEINQKDKEKILSVKKEYGKLSEKKLLHIIYSHYPYYAINSEIIVRANLNLTERQEIENSKPKQKEKCLFTIGYEGRSIDEYLSFLIQNNIKILCDVRKNPLSRKYGFSKKSLKTLTNKLGIEYLHIPELGINSDLRKNLHSKEDYEKLFSLYKKKTLPYRKKELDVIISILNQKKRIALTCFESESSMCHRSCVSETLKKKNNNINVKHL